MNKTRYVYNRLEQRLGCATDEFKQSNLPDQTLTRGDGPMQSKIVLSFTHGPVIRLEDAEVSFVRDGSGMVVLKSSDSLRDYAGVQYTLFFMRLVDIQWEFSDGAHHRFSGWVMGPLQFYPPDWEEMPELVADDERFPPSVFALNLPSYSRPMRVSIDTYYNHKDWTI